MYHRETLIISVLYIESLTFYGYYLCTKRLSHLVRSKYVV